MQLHRAGEHRMPRPSKNAISVIENTDALDIDGISIRTHAEYSVPYQEQVVNEPFSTEPRYL